MICRYCGAVMEGEHCPACGRDMPLQDRSRELEALLAQPSADRIRESSDQDTASQPDADPNDVPSDSSDRDTATPTARNPDEAREVREGLRMRLLEWLRRHRAGETQHKDAKEKERTEDD